MSKDIEIEAILKGLLLAKPGHLEHQNNYNVFNSLSKIGIREPISI